MDKKNRHELWKHTVKRRDIFIYTKIIFSWFSFSFDYLKMIQNVTILREHTNNKKKNPDNRTHLNALK